MTLLVTIKNGRKTNRYKLENIDGYSLQENRGILAYDKHGNTIEIQNVVYIEMKGL